MQPKYNRLFVGNIQLLIGLTFGPMGCPWGAPEGDLRETRTHATKNRGPQVIPGLEGVQCTGGWCVEFATPRGGEEEGEEEVLRRLVTPKGVGGYRKIYDHM